MEQLGAIVSLVVGLIVILAVLEVFYIGATLKKIDATLRELLVAVKRSDANRRAEFKAMSAPDGE